MSSLERVVKFLKESRKSDALLVLLLVVAVDLVCRVGFSLHEQKVKGNLSFDVPYRNRAWWVTKDFLHQTSIADVILLGASDINTALYTAEATYFKTPQSQLLKHKSEYLERKLKELDSPYKTTFCLSLGGEMPSDSYLLVNTLLTANKTPKAIVLAVSPRSFYDASFGDPANSSIYKTMAKLGGTNDFELTCRSSLIDIADHFFRQSIALYGHKWETTSWQQRIGQRLLQRVLPQRFDEVAAPEAIRRIAEQDLPEDYGPNEAVSIPYDETHPIFVDNLRQYRGIFKKVKRGMLPQQVAFYERLCQFCNARGIKLIVCNSPVTSENRELVPADVRAKYLAQVSAIATHFGATFVDLDKPELFDKSDFFDAAHLNGKGGQKYFSQVASLLSRDGGLAQAGNSVAN